LGIQTRDVDPNDFQTLRVDVTTYSSRGRIELGEHVPDNSEQADQSAMTDGLEAPGDSPGRLSRRGFAVGAAGVLAGLALDACGGSSGSTTSSGSATAAPSPKRGGTLTFAASGGGPDDSLDPYTDITIVGAFGYYQLYDGIAKLAADGSVALQLAEELVPNKDGTEWTIRLRKGVEFHDGRPLTSADVVASLRRMVKGVETASVFAAVDAAGAKALDPHTVRVPMHTPFFTLPEFLTYNSCVTPADWNPNHPVGTGPFKYVSFTPGRQMSFARNPNYWESGKPYLDAIVINNFNDETAQVNALQSGAANAANNFSLASARVLQTSGLKMLIGNTGQVNNFSMNCNVAPFSDVRVRQAMRLIVDRPQMLKTVFGQYGAIANDTMAATFDPLYVPLPQREQDLEQAKSLLAQAGHSGLTVKLAAAPVSQGLPEMAQVFAQQAKGAGVNVVLEPVTTAVLYGPEFLKWPFETDYNNYNTYLVNVSELLLPTSSYPETHFNNPRYTSLYHQTVATAELSMRRELAGEMQRIEYDQGGYIIPLFPPVLDAHAASVHGLQAGRSGLSFNVAHFTDAWIE
jgi:peptide/nickel transport system substrate-binding protein